MGSGGSPTIILKGISETKISVVKKASVPCYSESKDDIHLRALTCNLSLNSEAKRGRFAG